MSGIQQIRRGFKTIEEAQSLMNNLAHPDQFEIEAIYGSDLTNTVGDYLAYCVIPRRPRQSSVAHR
jgi:hypothetical protein